MLSAKFSCERTLWKKDMTRFWPLWVAYTVMWALILPLRVFSEAAYLAPEYARLGLPGGWVGDMAIELICDYNGVVIAAVYGVLCAMAVWSYLYSPRSANALHALPVRREGHFAAHYLAGLSFFTLPHLITLVLTALAGAAKGSAGDLPWLAAAMGIQTLLCLFFFSFATLCAFVTGHILALPVFYLIGNYLVIALCYLLDWLIERFLFGVVSFLYRTSVLLWFTPTIHLGSRLRIGYDYVVRFADGSATTGTSFGVLGIVRTYEPGSPSVSAYEITRNVGGLNAVLIYAAVGLVLAGLALVLYRRRHLETAGDVVAVPWLRPVFQYGVALCAALAGAWVTVDILGSSANGVLTALLVGWGVIGYFVARMFLQKSLKVFKSGWKGGAVTAAVLLALCLCFWADLPGLERRMPDPARIESVYVGGLGTVPSDDASYSSMTIDDPALIQKIVAAHQAVVDHLPELKAADNAYRRSNSSPYGGSYSTFRVQYFLQGGGMLERAFRLYLSPDELGDPDSVVTALNALVNDKDYLREAYGVDDVDPARMTRVQVNWLYEDGEGIRNITFYTPFSDYAAGLESFPLDVGTPDGPAAASYEYIGDWYKYADDGDEYRPAGIADLAPLWNAVLADLEDGSLGRRSVIDDDPAYTDTAIDSRVIFFWQRAYDRGSGETYYSESSVTIALTTDARRTLAALEKLGVFDGGLYVTDLDGERVYPQ